MFEIKPSQKMEVQEANNHMNKEVKRGKCQIIMQIEQRPIIKLKRPKLEISNHYQGKTKIVRGRESATYA